MNDHLPQSVRDLHSYIESIPFGEVEFKITRINRNTTQISTIAQETLKYVSNEEAKKDLNQLVDKLCDPSFSGEAHIKLQVKDGQINLMGIFNKKEKKYG